MRRVIHTLWADEGVYYPVDFEPYTPTHHFAKGKKDPQFCTKLKLAVELVHRAVQAHIPFRAVVADSFYGEDRGVKQGLRALGVGYVLALKPSHAWWHPEGTIGSFQEAAQAARWKSPERPGKWVKVTRTFRNGSSQDWWALEVVTGPYGPEKQERIVIATTDPATLPDLTTFYLVTKTQPFNLLLHCQRRQQLLNRFKCRSFNENAIGRAIRETLNDTSLGIRSVACNARHGHCQRIRNGNMSTPFDEDRMVRGHTVKFRRIGQAPFSQVALTPANRCFNPLASRGLGGTLGDEIEKLRQVGHVIDHHI